MKLLERIGIAGIFFCLALMFYGALIMSVEVVIQSCVYLVIVLTFTLLMVERERNEN